jgi:sec-independent protein translocase protein TatC
MSSALDEDTRQTLDAGRETAGAMLRAAQKDLQKVFVVFLVGFIGSFYALRLFVWDFLKGVTEAQMDAATQGSYEIIAQTPFDVILLQAKIGLVVGIILGLPVFVYFSRDALRERDLWPQSPVPLWKAALLLVSALALFVLGLLYGYLVFFPFMFAFLANNALSAGFSPTYSIVLWAQFIFFLTLSFGLAAQLPLVVTGLSYAEIIPYETFRDKWRHAIVGMFAMGALFTPPDPFTQVMWAGPMLALYGFSLYLAKVVVTARRGSERISVPAVARERWNVLAGGAVLGFVAVYGFYTRGGVAAVNDLLVWAGSEYRFYPAGTTLGVAPEVAVVAYGVVAGLVGAALALGYVVYAALDATVRLEAGVGDPTKLDLGTLDAAGVRAAPPEAFAEMSEDEVLAAARAAMDDDDPEKAEAIFDRYDEAEVLAEAGQLEDGKEEEGVGERTSRAAGVFAEELSEGETDEDDIGGYMTDIAFIVDSVTSRSFRLAAVFGITLVVVFGWLYTGGIGRVFEQFLARLPGEVTPDTVTVVALHPVEALIFEMKFSALVAVFVTMPLLAYYAWPALRERNVVRGHQRVIFGWTGALVAGLLGGFALGYLYFAPTIISWLVADALTAEMIIAYRITNFFWLIVFTTLGIGVLADVPVLMVLLNTAGVSYRTMRHRWREVTVGILAFAAVFTPAGITTMFLVTVPLLAVYWIGIGVLFVLTLGGRRDLVEPRWTPEADTDAESA